ncbi:4Fe-4S dicluster domain-containing protein [Desulfotalea psychrophila]|nr:4Fe-4S binding protein [Desulfotalea psychrophila]
MEKKVSASPKASAPQKGAKAKKSEVPAKETGSVAPKEKKRILYSVKFFYEWCKSCGLCSALCPKQVISTDETGKPRVENPDACIGCRICEIHCPDFAITVKKRKDTRRSTDGKR